jgi:hypothetical protein
MCGHHQRCEGECEDHARDGVAAFHFFFFRLRPAASTTTIARSALLLAILTPFSQLLDHGRIVLLLRLTFVQVTGLDHPAAFIPIGRISTLCFGQSAIRFYIGIVGGQGTAAAGPAGGTLGLAGCLRIKQRRFVFDLADHARRRQRIGWGASFFSEQSKSRNRS